MNHGKAPSTVDFYHYSWLLNCKMQCTITCILNPILIWENWAHFFPLGMTLCQGTMLTRAEYSWLWVCPCQRNLGYTEYVQSYPEHPSATVTYQRTLSKVQTQNTKIYKPNGTKTWNKLCYPAHSSMVRAVSVGKKVLRIQCRARMRNGAGTTTQAL